MKRTDHLSAHFPLKNAYYYEDNSDSCELWVPGSPLFPLEQVVELKSADPLVSGGIFRQALTGETYL